MTYVDWEKMARELAERNEQQGQEACGFAFYTGQQLERLERAHFGVLRAELWYASYNQGERCYRKGLEELRETMEEDGQASWRLPA